MLTLKNNQHVQAFEFLLVVLIPLVMACLVPHHPAVGIRKRMNPPLLTLMDEEGCECGLQSEICWT